MNKVPPIFLVGFRPFFLLAALIAVLNPTIWVSILTGHSSFSLQTDFMFWHGHEMVFGFTGALIGGFLLTASSHWTGKPPFRGIALFALSLIFILSQFTYFIEVSTLGLFIFTNIYLPCLTFMMFIMLRDHPRQKYVFIPFLIAFTMAKLLHSYGQYYHNQEIKEYGLYLGTGLVRLIILLIAGRVVPFFTSKRLPDVTISVPPKAKAIAMVPIVLLLVPFPEALPEYIKFTLYLWAFLANSYLFYLWRPFSTLKVPILWILHTGLFFIISSLLTDALSIYFDFLNTARASLHLLMAGGLGVVSVGMMTRVSLGHTGRIINADKWMIFAFICVILGGLLRFLIPVFIPSWYISSLHHSSGFWTLGFLIFLFKFTRILCTPRPDGR